MFCDRPHSSIWRPRNINPFHQDLVSRLGGAEEIYRHLLEKHRHTSRFYETDKQTGLENRLNEIVLKSLKNFQGLGCYLSDLHTDDGDTIRPWTVIYVLWSKGHRLRTIDDTDGQNGFELQSGDMISFTPYELHGLEGSEKTQGFKNLSSPEERQALMQRLQPDDFFCGIMMEQTQRPTLSRLRDMRRKMILPAS